MGKGKSGLDSWNQNYGCELPYACLPCPKEKKEMDVRFRSFIAIEQFINLQSNNCLLY